MVDTARHQRSSIHGTGAQGTSVDDAVDAVSYDEARGHVKGILRTNPSNP